MSMTKRKILDLKTAKELKENALIGETFEELILPEGMMKIPGSMCEICHNLKKVVLPSTLKRIGIGAFCRCSQLFDINIPDGIEDIGENTFQSCKSLKQITIPSSLKRLSPEIFDSSGIESIELPEGLEEIGYWAFYCCHRLKTLVIPKSVRHIERGIVTAHKCFEGLVCHADGYHVENDALIDDEKQELLCCWTQQKHYVVPMCVRKIADISANTFIESIIVKQPVELTTNDTFVYNLNLREIIFLGGVSGITKNTFYNCLKLRHKNHK